MPPPRGSSTASDLDSLVVLLVVLIPAFAEELAWRGYAVPRLLPFMSPLGAALVLAVPWTIMHLPLVLVPGSINEGVAVIPMVMALFSYSIILTWIFVGSGGSVLLTAIVHAGLNGVVPIFQNLDADQSWLWRGIIAAVIAVLVVPLREHAAPPSLPPSSETPIPLHPIRDTDGACPLVQRRSGDMLRSRSTARSGAAL